MKKLLLLLSVVCAVVITGCDNDTSVNPQPLGKAAISGIVTANFNETNDSPKPTLDVAANKKAVVTTKDSKGSVKITEITTDAEGKYLVETEIGNQSLTVTIEFVDFRADVVKAGGNESKIFKGTIGPVTIVKGGEYIRDITLN